tara:strand:- start:494 stop:1597 length:1104 start_codon:yes stop_codon:yes gene_type:complete
MKIKKELDPVVNSKGNSQFQISFWYNGKRFRYSSGKTINLDIQPNMENAEAREKKAQLLRSAFEIEISKGWRPKAKEKIKVQAPSLLELSSRTLERKLKMNYSLSYKTDLQRVHRQWTLYCQNNSIDKKLVNVLTIDIIRDFVVACASSPKSMVNLKRNISSLIKEEAEDYGIQLNLKRIKLPKTSQQLHKPLRDVEKLIYDIKKFNDKLFLCALLTFGMLLRPHREIRCLKRNDFNANFTLLSLNGERVKSKRNRIIPVPGFIQTELHNRFSHLDGESNLFTQCPTPHYKDYFKGLWTKYKNQSLLLEPEQTLYSFRHTGAIKVFEKTGSLLKLQQVMGHSDMKVSLTYLRGLEVKRLDVEDLPEL